LVEQLHRDFVQAGSDVVEASTYYAHRAKLRLIGLETEDINRTALRVARPVVRETGTLFAGNICNTPSGFHVVRVRRTCPRWLLKDRWGCNQRRLTARRGPWSRQTPMGDAILRVEDLEKRFGELRVLRGVSLTVGRGEVVVIIGPSGSGKSTLLKCLNRLEEPTAGHIFLEGVEVTGRRAHLPKIRRDIGMVFQHFNLFPHMTALQNVMEGPRTVLRLAPAEARRSPTASSWSTRVSSSSKGHRSRSSPRQPTSGRGAS